MPTTENRISSFYESKLNVSNPFNFDSDLNGSTNIDQNLKSLKNDFRPLEFSSPVREGLTPSLLEVVHTAGSPKTGGFFGNDRNGGTKPHRGIDIRADVNTPVMAAEDGVVVKSTTSETYGKVVYINHRDGYQTRYAHLNELDVPVGVAVKKGQMLGLSGKTGNANEPGIMPHVHFEIRHINEHAPAKALLNNESTALDPLPFLLKNKFHFEESQEFSNLNASLIKA